MSAVLSDENAPTAIVVRDGSSVMMLRSESAVRAVVLRDTQTPGLVVSGFAGPQGPRGQSGGGPGGSDANYVFYQSTPAATWNVTHGLNKYPSASVVDSAGNLVFGGLDYVDANNLTLTFAAPFTGRAYLN